MGRREEGEERGGGKVFGENSLNWPEVLLLVRQVTTRGSNRITCRLRATAGINGFLLVTTEILSQASAIFQTEPASIFLQKAAVKVCLQLSEKNVFFYENTKSQIFF